MIPKSFLRPREKFRQLRLKHEATYALKELPEEIRQGQSNLPPAAELRIDRWTPDNDKSKNGITEFSDVRGGWKQIGQYPLWYGFEAVTEFSKKHSGDYYDLVIIRPERVYFKDALRIVERNAR